MQEPARPLAIANRQRRARPRRDDIRALADRVLDREAVAGGVEIAFVGERTIRRLHRDWLEDDTITDVISFSSGEPVPGPEAGRLAVGEVVVCVPVCERSARSLRVALHDEIARMLIHGILHVVGYDHDTPAKNRKMRAIERRHLAWYRRSGLRVVDARGGCARGGERR